MSELSAALHRLVDLARLQETLPGIALLDAGTGVAAAEQIAVVARDLAARRAVLDDDEQAVVERARLALVDGWLTSVTLHRLADAPDELRSWLTTARQIDGL